MVTTCSENTKEVNQLNHSLELVNLGLDLIRHLPSLDPKQVRDRLGLSQCQ